MNISYNDIHEISSSKGRQEQYMDEEPLVQSHMYKPGRPSSREGKRNHVWITFQPSY